ncbi:MAG: DegT/DnrJ/EryC1/StrS family aminotransferase [Bacteroidetes bacterium]|nr:DegT/DnrJ/EryC1/StrS family aminotransferase [Bacteroidota bacterium]
MKNPIYVTQPTLPPLEEFTELLKQIWDNKILTNNGPFHQRFENELAKFLGVKYISLFANGTLALMTALQTLRITGEVITTPYTFVATTNALLWNGLKPIFVDVDPKSANIDPEKIEAAITNDTTAILPVHVYGNPCKVDRIQDIADTYGLKVIYDAAHAFNVKVGGQSILNHGNLSVLSFHATKVFNTIEGGAIICHDEKTKIRIDYLKNFGFAGETTIIAPGINAKMNELQAAYGLLQLKYVEENIKKRKIITEKYNSAFAEIDGIGTITIDKNIEYNYPYYPILINEGIIGKSRDAIYDILEANNIHARRYFYPLVSEFPMYRGLDSAKKDNLQHAFKIAEQVLCLPIYPDLEIINQNRIIELITKLSK